MITIDTTRSTMITKIQYDEVTRELTLTFAKGDDYKYDEVPASVFEALIAAESEGKYFSAHIKGKYNFERINAL